MMKKLDFNEKGVIVLNYDQKLSEMSDDEGKQEVKEEHINIKVRDMVRARAIDAREIIIAFIPEFAAYLLNRLHKGEDGRVVEYRQKNR